MTTILELKNITAGYETVPVLKNVNLKVEEQDFIGLAGKWNTMLLYKIFLDIYLKIVISISASLLM